MRKLIGTAGLAMVATLAVAGGSAKAAPAVCDPATIAGYFRSADLDRMLSNREAAKSSCQEKVVFCSGRLAAILYRDKAMRDANGDAGLETLSTTLEKGKALGSPWQVLSALGEVKLAQGRDARDEQAKSAANKAALSPNPVADDFFQAASDAYERAVNDIHDGSPCGEFGEPGTPPPQQIARVMKSMQEAKLLAPTFKVTAARDIECGGVFLTEIRGFEPESVPVPIEFDYDQATLTPKGAEAAAGLAKCVILGKAGRIVLSGHTDLRGSQDYNMNLSARRLETVRGFLLANGYRGAIALIPKGKAEPFVPTTGSNYQPADLDRMNRRVVLRETKQ